MRITYDSNGNLSINFEGDKHTDVWSGLSEIEEVFYDRTCGKCNKPNAKFCVRVATKGSKTHPYHELRCQNPKCRAVKSFGIRDDGTHRLFPKTKVGPSDALFDDFKKNSDDKVAYLPNNGWLRYDKDTGKKF